MKYLHHKTNINRFSKPILLGLYAIALAMLGGCITYKRPYQAEWTKPLRLNLGYTSLKGRKIEILCAQGKEGEEPALAYSDSCEILAYHLVELGALIIGDYGESTDAKKENLKSDFKVTIIEFPNQSDFGGWTTPFCIFTMSFFPCVEDIKTRADLRISDGMRAESFSYTLDVRKYIGPFALALMGVGSLNNSYMKYKKDLPRRLMSSIANRIYTFDVTRQLKPGRYSL